MSGQLTTHVLDTACGRPAAGLRIELRRTDDEAVAPLSFTTNADGRVDTPLLTGDALHAGTYELRFHAGDYFRGIQNPDAGTFLDVIPIVFRVTDPSQHHHVPLLVSPWSYSTYRGS